MPIDGKVNSFIRFGKLTVVLIYLVVLAGGIVRATGSGMGCPDWPKCFDRWIPPTQVSELPGNYQEIYADRGYASVEFNAVKTWIEYINRLLGVLVGFSILLFFCFSLYFLSKSKLIVILAFISFVLVGFQGWLGALVVSSLLAEWMITIHMLVALIIVLLVLFTIAYAKYVLVEAYRYEVPVHNYKLLYSGYVLVLVVLIQVLLGTQVREGVDQLLKAGVVRTEWINQLGVYFHFHRIVGILTLVSIIFWVRYVDEFYASTGNLVSRLIISSLVIETLAGLILAYFDLPAWIQPIHLLMGTVLIGLIGYKMTSLQLRSFKTV